MRPLLSVAPVARPLPRGLTLCARINPDIPNHAAEGCDPVHPLYVQVQERAQGVMESRPVLWYKDTDLMPLGLAAPRAKLMKNLKGRPSAEEHIE